MDAVDGGGGQRGDDTARWREASAHGLAQNIQQAALAALNQHRPQVVSRCHLKKNLTGGHCNHRHTAVESP